MGLKDTECRAEWTWGQMGDEDVWVSGLTESTVGTHMVGREPSGSKIKETL